MLFFRLIRIKDALKWESISFLGFLLGLELKGNIFLSFFFFAISTFCIMSFTFLVNNYFDAESDKENPRRREVNVIASGEVSRREAIYVMIILFLLPLLLCTFLKPSLLPFCVLMLFFGWAYSSPPLRIKGRAGWDIVWHFLGFVLIVVWGSLSAGSLSLMQWLVAVSLGVFSCVGQIGNHIADYEFDKKSGTVTFAVKVGLDRAKRVLNFTTALHLLLLIPLVYLYVSRSIYSIAFMVASILLGYVVLRPRRGAFPTKRCYTYFFSVVVGGAVYGGCLIYKLIPLLT